MAGDILKRVWIDLLKEADKDRKEQLIAKWFSILLLAAMFSAVILSQPNTELKLLCLVIASVFMGLFLFLAREKGLLYRLFMRRQKDKAEE